MHLGDLRVVENELDVYGHGLLDRPRIVVLNKQELVSDRRKYELVSSCILNLTNQLILPTITD
jgi:GTPase involved in cell partitioning and DNA repair